jgi:Flp pilus assembly protein TadD
MRFRYWLAVLAVAALVPSCVKRTRVVGQPAAPAVARPLAPAPVSAFDRQIRNAKDAGDGDLELRVLRARVAAQPDNVAARLALAKGYHDRGYPDVALEVCRLAASRFAASGEVELALIRELRDLEQPAEAIASLEAFLKAHPQNAPEYYSWLGILHDENVDWAVGEQSHRKALDLAPSRDYLYNNLGYNLLMQKRYEEAAAAFRECLRMNAASRLARNNLGLALANLGQTEQALASWEAVADHATAHNNLAVVLLEKRNFPEARKELLVALRYNGSHPEALKNLELISRLDGNPAELPVTTAKSRWERWKSGLHRFWVGPPVGPQVPEAGPEAEPQDTRRKQTAKTAPGE